MFIHLYSWIYPRKNPIMIDMIGLKTYYDFSRLYRRISLKCYGGSQAVESGPALRRKWRVVGLGNGIAFQRRLGPRGIPSALRDELLVGIWDELGNLIYYLYIYISLYLGPRYVKICQACLTEIRTLR